MQIIYHGLGCFRLQDGVSVLVDPFDESAGLKIPKQQNDIVVYGNVENKWRPANKETFLVTEPGEYEVKKVFVYSLPVGSEKLINIIEMDGVTVAHLGLVSKSELTAEHLERLEDVDILCIGVGGNDNLSAKQAQELITELEPRIVIPMYYQISGSKLKMDNLDAFKKEIGGNSETMDKLKINRKDLPAEETKFIIIEPTL